MTAFDDDALESACHDGVWARLVGLLRANATSVEALMNPTESFEINGILMLDDGKQFWLHNGAGRLWDQKGRPLDAVHGRASCICGC